MVERKVTIVNASGLHARPAADLVDFVKNYPGKVEVLRDEQVGNLKSILMVMSMGLTQGTEVTLRVQGENEEAFADKLSTFIANMEG